MLLVFREFDYGCDGFYRQRILTLIRQLSTLDAGT